MYFECGNEGYMEKTLRTLTLLSALNAATAAYGQEDNLTEAAFGDSSDPEEVSCIFETASFNGVVVRGEARDYMEADKLLEIEEVAGGPLPVGQIDMVSIKYSLCGSEGHEVEEYFDRVDVISFMDDEYSLAPAAVEAFAQANEMFTQIPCDEANIEWISGTLSDTGMDAYLAFCPANQ